jgi:hypothetical protein
LGDWWKDEAEIGVKIGLGTVIASAPFKKKKSGLVQG